MRYSTGYMACWLHRLLFFNLSPNMFLMLYGVFFGLVIATLIGVRPNRPVWIRSGGGYRGRGVVSKAS